MPFIDSSGIQTIKPGDQGLMGQFLDAEAVGLRLRVAVDPATVDQRFLVDEARLDSLSNVIARHWPQSIAPDELGDSALIAQIAEARAALVNALGVGELQD